MTNVPFDRSLMLTRDLKTDPAILGGPGKYKEILRKSGAVCTRIVEPGQRASAPSTPAAPPAPKAEAKVITAEQFASAFKRR